MGGSGVWWNANCAMERARSELADRREDMPRTRRVSDTNLVRRSQQGDRRAFRALLARYDWRLHGLAHALLLDPARVDAVLRVAYIRAWREVVRIDAKDDASAWLYRVAYNACIDVLRRESARAGTAPPNGAAALGPDRAAATPAGRADGATRSGSGAGPPAPEGRADAHARDVPAAAGDGAGGGPQPQLVAALTSLAAADRVAVVLVDREGFAPGAAARILGLTDEVLAARLAGARARLARQAGLAVAAASPSPRTVVAEQGDDGEQHGRDDGGGEQDEQDDDGGEQHEQQDGGELHGQQDDGGELHGQDGEQHGQDGEQDEQDDDVAPDEPDATIDHDGPRNADEPRADDTPAGPDAEESEGPSAAAKVVASRSANGTTGNGAKPSEGSS